MGFSEFFVLWLLFSGAIGYLANSRGRSGFAFFALSIFLSPLLGLVIVLATSNLKELEERDRQRREDHERQFASIQVLAGSQKSIADELLKLAELRDRGVLTEEEFNAQKRSILKS
jgi:hypothetical protein